MTAKWEAINSTFGNISLKRMRTPTGWLVRTEDGESLVHIIDAGGVWVATTKLSFTGIPASGKLILLRRARIPGGWLLAGYQTVENSTKLTFIPDPDWSWVL